MKKLIIAVLATFATFATFAHNRDDYAPDTLEQINAVAFCLYVEARGESWEGKIAVASVLINRQKWKLVSFKDIVFKPRQFSGCNGLSDVPTWFISGKGLTGTDKSARIDCYTLAERAVFGSIKPAGNWTHFYNPSLCLPYWSHLLTDRRVIGSHIFGRLERF